jgi:nicotinamidase-related amidase
MTFLLLIDIQVGFYASASPEFLHAVKQEIKDAIRYNREILCLRYIKHGPLRPEIKTLLEKYDRFCSVWKNSDDGALEALDKLFRRGYNLDRQIVRVCGCNTNFCVKDTVTSLSKYVPRAQIEVVAPACNCYTGNRFGWIKKLKNVNLVHLGTSTKGTHEKISGVA